MGAKHYAFQVGNMDCTVLLDGDSVLGREGIVKRYPAATEAEYRQAYANIGLSLEEADSSFNILLAKMGNETVLVDTGNGFPRGGYLPESMWLAGIAPEAVTLVVITHTHGDHILGAVTDESRPVFPNASYVMSRPEMVYWRTRMEEGLADQRPIFTMMEAQGLRLINMDESILPGLTAMPIPGHTPGQIGLLFESEGEKLLHLADLLHSPMQFAHPEWSPTFDADTSVSVPSRREALGRAAAEDTLTLFYHLTFPGLGRVKQAEKHFVWEPVEA